MKRVVEVGEPLKDGDWCERDGLKYVYSTNEGHFVGDTGVRFPESTVHERRKTRVINVCREVPEVEINLLAELPLVDAIEWITAMHYWESPSDMKPFIERLKAIDALNLEGWEVVSESGDYKILKRKDSE